ncbi:hypothetical protein A7A08_01833 [Methyloligella halotolerans]|uniref:Uncharacterized protein n=1 Tax=Methyloligella halotolerans TaxID=1177755 RepID=A0A1E2RYB0_9HYPH|nr:hypothetical protein A7A08_01833 [Methyloligella halotolerans]
MGGADGNLREGDMSAFQAAGSARQNVAAIELDLRAQRFEGMKMKIDGAGSDGAAAGQRDLGLVHPGDQGAEHPEAGAHARDQLIGRGRVDDLGGGQPIGLAVAAIVAVALADDREIDAMIAEDARQLSHVGEMGHVVQCQGVGCQQTRDHQRERRVLGARDRNAADKRIAPNDSDTVHSVPSTPSGRGDEAPRIMRRS